MPISPSTRFSNCLELKFKELISSEILLASMSSSLVRYPLLSVLTRRNASCSEYQGCLSCNLFSKKNYLHLRINVPIFQRDLLQIFLHIHDPVIVKVSFTYQSVNGSFVTEVVPIVISMIG